MTRPPRAGPGLRRHPGRRPAQARGSSAPADGHPRELQPGNHRHAGPRPGERAGTRRRDTRRRRHHRPGPLHQLRRRRPGAGPPEPAGHPADQRASRAGRRRRSAGGQRRPGDRHDHHREHPLGPAKHGRVRHPGQHGHGDRPPDQPRAGQLDGLPRRTRIPRRAGEDQPQPGPVRRAPRRRDRRHPREPGRPGRGRCHYPSQRPASHHRRLTRHPHAAVPPRRRRLSAGQPESLLETVDPAAKRTTPRLRNWTLPKIRFVPSVDRDGSDCRPSGPRDTKRPPSCGRSSCT